MMRAKRMQLLTILLVIGALLMGCNALKPVETSQFQTDTLALTPTPSPEPTAEPTAEPTPEPTTASSLSEETGYSEAVELPDFDLCFKLYMPLWNITAHEAGVTLTWFPYDPESPMITFRMFPYEGDPEIIYSQLIFNALDQFADDDAIWQDGLDRIEIGNGHGLTRTMEVDALKAEWIWFGTAKNIYQIVSVYMHDEQAGFINTTLQGIFESLATISGDMFSEMYLIQAAELIET